MSTRNLVTGSEARMQTEKYNTLATRQGKTKTIYT